MKRILLLLSVFFLLSDAVAQLPGNNEISRLSKALQFETISSDDSTLFNGNAFKNFIDYLQESFPLTHQELDLKIISNFSLVYHWKGMDEKKKSVLFLGHYDVVPAEETIMKKWTHPPFSGYVDSLWIWGRGAIDDKFQVVALLETIENLLQENFKPGQSIYFAFGHDEEVNGEQGALKIAEYFKQKNLEFEMILDEGGIMVEEVFPGIKKTIALIGNAEKGEINIELSVHSDGGHSSAPPEESAIDILAKAISKLNENPMKARLQSPTMEMLKTLAPHFDSKTKFAIRHMSLFKKKILKKLAANNGSNALIRTVMTPTIFRGGVKENSLPTMAVANLNIRILQGDSIESVMEHIQKVITDDRVQLVMKKPYHNPSPITPAGGKPWDVLSKTINETWPDVVIAPLVAPGTTDSRHYSSLSKNILRFIPVTINNESKEQIHGVDERISIKEYQQAILFYINLVKKINTEF